MMLLVVSGASRGFGQAVAAAFAKAATVATATATETATNNGTAAESSGMRAMLIARSRQGLEETKSKMILAAQAANKEEDPNREQQQKQEKLQPDESMILDIYPMDLSNLETLEENMKALIDAAKPLDKYDEGIFIINNAGSLGHLGPMASPSSSSSLRNLQESIDLNVTSSMWFTTCWVKAIKESWNTNCDSCATTSGTTTPTTIRKTPTATIVNVSSLCALEPFPTMTTYCTGKAARDMFHQSLAKEEEEEEEERAARLRFPDKSPPTATTAPPIRFLNYAPGAMDTAMTTALRLDAPALSKSLHDYFRRAHERRELIDPAASALKLVRLLRSGDTIVNGSHVDYWDVGPGP